MANIHQKLSLIQIALSVPKNEENKFGKYMYRTCEGILTALKPLLQKHQCYVLLNDKIVEIGGRFYVESTATLVDIEGNEAGVASSVEVKGYAREDESKKGTDVSQITGAASSYARKYALNGLFAIDEGKDTDALNINDDYTTPAKNHKNVRDVTPQQPNQIGYQNQQPVPQGGYQQNGYQGQPQGGYNQNNQQGYQQAPQNGYQQAPQADAIPMKTLDDKRFSDAMAQVRNGNFAKSRLINGFMLTQSQLAEIQAFVPPPNFPQ